MPAPKTAMSWLWEALEACRRAFSERVEGGSLLGARERSAEAAVLSPCLRRSIAACCVVDEQPVGIWRFWMLQQLRGRPCSGDRRGDVLRCDFGVHEEGETRFLAM